ncbi:MAG: DNA mismatch repair endonuclease MutL [Bacteroidia bacterium]
MSDIIKLLPEHVANQIAAGEVIQRPASIVKELLDNSIDAGATHIKLIVKDAGKALVQVIDNGKGMSETDARMCWERHATSKITSIADVFKIKTMGFRGEALASIASVAKVELKTKRDEDAVGTFIVIEGSNTITQEAVACPTGTSITVKNLFFNIPARRNFLKSNPVELRHIIDEFTRAALANPTIGFELFHNDDMLHNLKPADFAFRICDLFDDKKPENLLLFEEQTTIINTNGFIGKPQIAKKTRGEQFIFVNNRFIKDAYLNHAIVTGFENIIAKDQYPFYCINIEIDPSKIDVNIHPTKTEVKFEDERNIYQILRAVTRKVLGENFETPTLDNSHDDNRFLQRDLYNNQATHFNNIQSNSSQTIGKFSDGRNDLFKNEYANSRNYKKQQTTNWEDLFKIAAPETPSEIPTSSEQNKQQTLIENKRQTSQQFLQVQQTYIATQIKSGMLLISQQAAHERILFEKYLIAIKLQPIVSQQKLFPKAITLNATDESILREIMPEIKALGFDVNEFGKSTFVVNGVPAEMQYNNEQDLILDLISNYKNNRNLADSKHELIAKILAKKAAIKAGTVLAIDEMNRIVDELFACNEPKYSPDGKACLLTLSMAELANMFK